ncbi:MAG TPA: phosphatase PAP2 family protein [Nitrososphaerales archaeon]|nr:phosphatase PAP2 family protein [Nitrososphaerales archaeon]
MNDRRLTYLAALGLALFLVLAVAVKSSDGLQRADLQAALWLNNMHPGSAVSSAMVAASLYGREYFWIPVAALMLAFGDRRTKLVAVGLCGVFVGGIVAGEVAKDLIARARPDQLLASVGGGAPIVRMPLDTDYSFPSGHAVIVSIGAVYALATFRKKWVAGLLTLEAAVVCVSRVFLFEHFPTDVLAGVALGSAVALGGLLLGRRYLRKSAERVAGALVKVLKEGPLRL